jgi:hypothetical protein
LLTDESLEKALDFLRGLVIHFVLHPVYFLREVEEMKKQLGNFVVLFRPGVITGVHNEREIALRNICERLGGLDCKVFDPYAVYAKFADDGLLLRVEQRNSYGFAAVSFYYPAGKDEKVIRNIMINQMLRAIKDDPKIIAGGYAIVIDKTGNLKLKLSKKLPAPQRGQPYYLRR